MRKRNRSSIKSDRDCSRLSLVASVILLRVGAALTESVCYASFVAFKRPKEIAAENSLYDYAVRALGRRRLPELLLIYERSPGHSAIFISFQRNASANRSACPRLRFH